ncbi:hypothetical protein DdX_21980 [Ditylenchus destructor]|uniref:C2H2-type domain-containing protein n=1 Tax=Ditylenchus destructor TaxID=166010 RepID=A0AAD4QUT1_9BILA|nr:hypothetical protein DdX_21980 [Ditylenchus destructor]
MSATPFFCDECHLAFEDEKVVSHHIAAMHLNYFPYQCLNCKGTGANYNSISVEMMQDHTATAHVGSGLNYNTESFDLQCLKNELNAAIEHFRRPNENGIKTGMKHHASEQMEKPRKQPWRNHHSVRSENSLEYAQMAVISKSQEQIGDQRIQGPITKMSKKLKTLRKEPVIFDAKKEQKKLCRTRSLSVVPNCNKPSISQHSARKPTMVDLDFDDEYEDEEPSPAKREGKQIKKSRSR